MSPEAALAELRPFVEILSRMADHYDYIPEAEADRTGAWGVQGAGPDEIRRVTIAELRQARDAYRKVYES